MSSYDYYIWLRALGEVVATLLPLVILTAVVFGGLVGWRWWLRSRYGDPKKVPELEKRLWEVETRLHRLEEPGDGGSSGAAGSGDDEER